MRKHKLLAGILAAALVVTSVPAALLPADQADAAVTPVETTITKTQVSNPIVSTYPNSTNLLYGGDPSVLVDGDTVYLYVGRDAGIGSEAYYMPDWQCFSTKDLKTWKHEGTIMSSDKTSITWANTGTDAWAGQIEKYKNKYYFYYCTWDATSGGQQSIGVATSNSPTGPFKDKGEPLVKGTTTSNTSGNWSNFNDIDPTVWVEKDSTGKEHRYLSWGNNKLFVCELNEDMTSVKDVNGDGKITFGVQADGASSKTADIIEKDVTGLDFTEAPWIYRRKDANGTAGGSYYLFYAHAWREEMAYATTDNLMDGKLKFGKTLMPPTATSNTNHPAVFDWKGKTYFVYHNGSLPGGQGSRRSACITELHFKKDGSIYEIPETAIGITGATPYVLYTNNGGVISHENFTNSSADGTYPYADIGVGTYFQPKKQDANWAIVAGKADPSKASYVSIQSENKPGLYLTVNDNNTVSLAQDTVYHYDETKNDRKTFTADGDIAKTQTFRTVKGLKDTTAVSFESVSKTGYYLCVDDGNLVVKALAECTDGTADFYLNKSPSATASGTGTANDVKLLKIDDTQVNKTNHTYEYTVSSDKSSVRLNIELDDPNGFATLNGKTISSSATLDLKGVYTGAALCIYSSDRKPRVTYTLIITKDLSNASPSVAAEKTFSFDNATGGAVAVTKAAPPSPVTSPSYRYTDGVDGNANTAIYLDGTYGLKLCDTSGFGSSYSVSFFMKPEELGKEPMPGVDPTLTGGVFSPEYWFNLSFGNGIWSRNSAGYVDTTPVTYTANQWQHVTLVVDGSTDGTATETSLAKLYVNGALAVEGNIAKDILAKTNAALYFGANAWDDYFKGALDNVTVYKAALPEDDVLLLSAPVAKKPSEYSQPDPNAASAGTFSEGDITYPDAVSSILPLIKVTTTDDNPPTASPTVKKVTLKVPNKYVKKSTIYMKKGSKVTLKATVTGSGNYNKTVTWKSSKPKVATVKNGKVTAKKKGTAKITATSKTDKTKKATITVKVSTKAKKNKTLKISPTKKTLKKGKTLTIKIKKITAKTTEKITYKSSKKSVATVDAYGKVKAKKKGKATITVKCGKKKAKLKLTVKK